MRVKFNLASGNYGADVVTLLLNVVTLAPIVKYAVKNLLTTDNL